MSDTSDSPQARTTASANHEANPMGKLQDAGKAALETLGVTEENRDEIIAALLFTEVVLLAKLANDWRSRKAVISEDINATRARSPNAVYSREFMENYLTEYFRMGDGQAVSAADINDLDRIISHLDPWAQVNIVELQSRFILHPDSDSLHAAYGFEDLAESRVNGFFRSNTREVHWSADLSYPHGTIRHEIGHDVDFSSTSFLDSNDPVPYRGYISAQPDFPQWQEAINREIARGQTPRGAHDLAIQIGTDRTIQQHLASPLYKPDSYRVEAQAEMFANYERAKLSYANDPEELDRLMTEAYPDLYPAYRDEYIPRAQAIADKLLEIRAARIDTYIADVAELRAELGLLQHSDDKVKAIRDIISEKQIAQIRNSIDPSIADIVIDLERTNSLTHMDDVTKALEQYGSIRADVDRSFISEAELKQLDLRIVESVKGNLAAQIAASAESPSGKRLESLLETIRQHRASDGIAAGEKKQYTPVRTHAMFRESEEGKNSTSLAEVIQPEPYKELNVNLRSGNIIIDMTVDRGEVHRLSGFLDAQGFTTDKITDLGSGHYKVRFIADDYSGNLIADDIERIESLISQAKAAGLPIELHPDVLASMRAVRPDAGKPSESPYRIVDASDPSVVELEETHTGKRVFAKVNPSGYEVDMIRRASQVTLPPDIDNVRIPKLISTDITLLPDGMPTDARSVIIMEAAQGIDLQEIQMGRRNPGSRWDRPDFRDFTISDADFEGLSRAVTHLNAEGVFHTDLKNSSNIFVRKGPDGRTYFELIDWGGPQDPAMRENDLAALSRQRESLREIGLVGPSADAPTQQPAQPDNKAAPTIQEQQLRKITEGQIGARHGMMDQQYRDFQKARLDAISDFVAQGAPLEEARARAMKGERRSYPTGEGSPIARVYTVDSTGLSAEQLRQIIPNPSTGDTVRLYRGLTQTYDPASTGSNFFSGDISVALAHGNSTVVVVDVPWSALRDLEAYRELQAAVGQRAPGFNESGLNAVELPSDWTNGGAVDQAVLRDMQGLAERVIAAEGELADRNRLIDARFDAEARVAEAFNATPPAERFSDLDPEIRDFLRRNYPDTRYEFLPNDTQRYIRRADPDYESALKAIGDARIARGAIHKQIAESLPTLSESYEGIANPDIAEPAGITEAQRAPVSSVSDAPAPERDFTPLNKPLPEIDPGPMGRPPAVQEISHHLQQQAKSRLDPREVDAMLAQAQREMLNERVEWADSRMRVEEEIRARVFDGREIRTQADYRALEAEVARQIAALDAAGNADAGRTAGITEVPARTDRPAPDEQRYNPLQDPWAIDRTNLLTEMDPKQRSIADQLMAQRRDLLQNQPAALDATGYMNAPEAQARMTIMAQRMAYGESVDRIFNKLWAEHQLALPEGFQLKPLTREDKILVSRMAAAGMRTPDVTGDGLNAKRSGNAGLSLDAPDLSARAPASADKPDNLTMRVDDAVARAGTVTDFGASTNSPLAAQDGISASLREAGIAVPPDATVVDLPSGRVVPKPSSGRGATGAGAGTGIAMTVLGAVMRNAEGGSMDRAEQVGGEQLRTEQAAANADLWVATADGALAAIVGAEKAREVLKPKAAAAVRPGMSASGTAARVLGPASILLAAGWTATEVNAARAAQDGSREASTLYGFLGGVGGGLVGGAGGGAVTGGPWGALIGGVLGGVGGGYMASEAGRESALGDQIQRNHDRESQLAVDQAIVRLQQMGRQFQSTGGLRERDERDLRTIVPALVEQYRRLQVLPIPTSDVDGGLRRNFQMRQIGDALDFLQGEKSATVLITSTQANQNALQQLPAIAAGLNANPQWRALFDYDKDGSVSQQDVRRTVAQQPGLNFAIMDIDGNGLRASEVASTLETIQRFRMENPRFRSAQDIALEYAIYRPFREFWAAEVHGNLNSEQELEAALGALNIPGMTGAELMAVIREYQIPTQALDPAKTGELSESFLVAAFDAYGAPREYMNGLVQNIIKLVPDLSESGGTPRDVTVDTLDMLRDTVEQSNAYQRAGQEEQFIELRAQAAEIARIFLVEGGSREKTSKQYSGHSLLVTRRESLEEAGMIAVFDTDGDNKISREERWSGIYKLGPRNPIGGGTLIPDLDGTFTVDIHEIYLALTPEQRELIDMEKYGNYVRAEAARLDKITTPVEYKAPEPVAETPVPENVSGEPIVIVQSRPSLPKRIIQQLAEAGVTNFVDANNDDVIQSRELVKALKGVKTSESDIDNFLEDGKLNRDVITRLQEASRRQER